MELLSQTLFIKKANFSTLTRHEKSDTSKMLTQQLYCAHSKLGEDVQVLRLSEELMAEVIATRNTLYDTSPNPFTFI